MNKICTSYEQSKSLLALGLDPNTADMKYDPQWDIPVIISEDDYDNHLNYDPEFENTDIPAWSLSALLKMIGDYTMQTDTLFRHFIVCDRERYITENYNEPLDAAFEMACRLLEIKKHNHE